MSQFFSGYEGVISNCLALLYLVACVVGILWVLSDAEERTGAGCAIALLVGLSGPIGLIIWFLFRPKHKLKPETPASIQSGTDQDSPQS